MLCKVIGYPDKYFVDFINVNCFASMRLGHPLVRLLLTWRSDGAKGNNFFAQRHSCATLNIEPAA
jgi:hypothetical protein